MSILMSYLKLFSLFFIIYLNLVSWSCNSWFMIWLVMEVLFLWFFSLLTYSSNYEVSESLMKYFIIQFLSSACFINLLIYYVYNMFWYCGMGCLVFLFVKMGMIPFHFWLISIMGKLDWVCLFLMMSFMKFQPIMLCYYMMINFWELIIMVCVISVVLGSLLGINNLSIQKLFGYSSITQTSWLLVSLCLTSFFFWLYVLIYFIMLFSFFMLMKKFNFFYLVQLKFSVKSYISKILIVCYSFTLFGFPPFSGFMLKWLVSSLMFCFNMKFSIFLMIFFSVISLVFYFQMFYYLIMIHSVHTKWFKLISLNHLVWTGSFFMLTSFMIILILW